MLKEESEVKKFMVTRFVHSESKISTEQTLLNISTSFPSNDALFAQPKISLHFLGHVVESMRQNHSKTLLPYTQRRVNMLERVRESE